MSDKKITELTLGTPEDTDVIPFVDLSTGTTKKSTKADLKGDKGDTGATGSAGNDGTTGATGAAGTDGSDGASSFVYIAYASDDTGTDFTTTFDSSLDHIAIKETTTAIGSPSSSDFTGLWKNYKGATGPTGAQGPQGDPGTGSGDMQSSTYDPAGVAEQLVGLTAPQTVTHKDLTSGTNTFPTFNQTTTGSAAKLTTARNIDGQSFDGSADITVIAPGTHAATGKTTPVDADELPLVDSAASNVLKKLTWANLKATAKTYFDTLYQPLNSTLTSWASKTVPSGTVVGTSDSQTLTNKTLTTPTISNPVMDATNPTAQTYTPSSAGTATLDLSLGNQHRITMPAGNITIALSNDTNSKVFLISITQDSVGSRTVAFFSTIKWAGGTAPTLTTTANKRDTFGFIRTGSGTYDGFVIGQAI
jgi:hypothetical protein